MSSRFEPYPHRRWRWYRMISTVCHHPQLRDWLEHTRLAVVCLNNYLVSMHIFHCSTIFADRYSVGLLTHSLSFRRQIRRITVGAGVSRGVPSQNFEEQLTASSQSTFSAPSTTLLRCRRRREAVFASSVAAYHHHVSPVDALFVQSHHIKQVKSHRLDCRRRRRDLRLSTAIEEDAPGKHHPPQQFYPSHVPQHAVVAFSDALNVVLHVIQPETSHGDAHCQA